MIVFWTYGHMDQLYLRNKSQFLVLVRILHIFCILDYSILNIFYRVENIKLLLVFSGDRQHSSMRDRMSVTSRIPGQ